MDRREQSALHRIRYKMDPQEEVYLQFYNYDFLEFPEYQEGLKQVFETFIFQHNENLQPGQPEITDINQLDKSIKQQLILQAQVYFFCEKTETILSLDDYFDWKNNYERGKESAKVEPLQPEPVQEAEPLDAPYSSNYEKIVDLIVNGKPVPGIKEIPDIVKEGQDSKQELQQRKKPWEKDENKDIVSVLDDERFAQLEST